MPKPEGAWREHDEVYGNIFVWRGPGGKHDAESAVAVFQHTDGTYEVWQYTNTAGQFDTPDSRGDILVDYTRVESANSPGEAAYIASEYFAEFGPDDSWNQEEIPESW